MAVGSLTCGCCARRSDSLFCVGRPIIAAAIILQSKKFTQLSRIQSGLTVQLEFIDIVQYWTIIPEILERSDLTLIHSPSHPFRTRTDTTFGTTGRACSVCVFFSAYLGRSIPSSLIYMLFCVPSMHHFCLNKEPPRNFELLHAIVKLIHNGFTQSPKGHLDPTSRHRWQSKRPDVTGGSGADLDQQSDWRRAGGARKHGLDNPKCVGED
ncbi:hypothetical protein LZ32DRAFT_232558 [Colletotrichum eremochloae]|nr:hypothetical protein LZ32DRAFT_232558 [Colletotrichum eremochloae]